VTAARRNLALLVACQAVFMTSTAVVATVGVLAGHALATDKALATLPATATVVGTALGTVPAALLMRRLGRRRGFMAGCAFAVVGGLISAGGVGAGSFALLLAGTLLVGVAAAFGQLYRFAAAEAVEPARRSRAISLVLAGGLAAGFLGPQLARATADLLPARFLATYALVPLLALVSVAILAGLDLPRMAVGAGASSGRPLWALVSGPLFLTAVVPQVTGYGVMNLLMTSAPLAMMAHHHHGLPDAAFVIQWHIVGMFLPSFFTGALVQRLGARVTAALGILANAAALVAGWAGSGVGHYWLSLTLVGVGWNLMFVAGSALAALAYPDADRVRAQAANDFLIWTTVGLTSLGSGQLLHHRGWPAILAAAAPLLLLAGAALVVGRVRPMPRPLGTA
jgi:MFS family permease